MSKVNLNRKVFLEREELVKLQQFIADSPSENAIIGNTSSWGILRTDFENADPNDFKVEVGSNAGTIKLDYPVNKAITKEGLRIYQEAKDNIQVPNDGAWYWIRVSHEYSNQEPGVVGINVNGEVYGTGSQFESVLRGQATKVPTKIKFIKEDGSAPQNSSIYEVVDVIDNNNCLLTSSIDFEAEGELKVIVLGSTPIGVPLSPEQEDGLYSYDSCNIEFVPETVTEEAPTNGFIDGSTFYIARVRNVSGTVTIEDKRTDWWEFNIVGLTDKLSIFNNLSDLSDIDEALDNLGFTVTGSNLTKVNPPSTSRGYLTVNPGGSVSVFTSSGFIETLEGAISISFLSRSWNLSDLNDFVAARDNLGVYGKSEVSDLFLEESNNLNDLNDKAAARSNLDVYSKSEVDEAPTQENVIIGASLGSYDIQRKSKFRTLVFTSTTPSSYDGSTPLFTLPSGDRPLNSMRFVISGRKNNDIYVPLVYRTMLVSSDGEVFLDNYYDSGTSQPDPDYISDVRINGTITYMVP